jgi:hypothetical protein
MKSEFGFQFWVVKIIFVALFNVPALAQSPDGTYKTEIFDQALNGKSKWDFLLSHRLTDFNYENALNPQNQTDETSNLSLLQVDYGYGISESVAVHFLMGYLLGNRTEDDTDGDSRSTEINGLKDFELRFSGNHYYDTGFFHWRVFFEYGLGEKKLKQTRDGNSAKFEENGFTGRTIFAAESAYAHKVGQGYLGLNLKIDVVKNKGQLENKAATGVKDELKIEGGRIYSAQLFYEHPTPGILWGGALGHFEVTQMDWVLEDVLARTFVNQQYNQFLIYSRIDLRPGHELYLGLNYDLYNRTGNPSTGYYLTDGNVIAGTVTYAIEY